MFAGVEDSQLLHPVDEIDEDMQLEDLKEVDTWVEIAQFN